MRTRTCARGVSDDLLYSVSGHHRAPRAIPRAGYAVGYCDPQIAHVLGVACTMPHRVMRPLSSPALNVDGKN
jgi:hypothetical protein